MDVELKDSGIKWIGIIPAEWTIDRIKTTCNLKGRIGWQGLKSDEFTDTGPYVITGVDFDSGKINWDSCNHFSEQRFNEDSNIHVKEGDLLITKDGTIGKVAIAENAPEFVSLNSGVMIIRPFKEINRRYLRYVLESSVFWNWYEGSQTGGSTIRHLYQEQFYGFKFPKPPLETQSAIAQYLDVECTRLDRLCAISKEKIQKLKELKQSIITESVTKGLDHNVDLKDSGIEWIGKIPVDWKLSPLKNVFTVYAGSTPKSDISEYWDGDIVWVTPSDMDKSQKEIASSKKKITHKGYDSANLTIVPSGSLILSTRAPVGTINISTTPLCTNQGCKSLVVKNCKTDVRFYYYFLSILDAPLNALSLGTTFLELSTRALESFQVPVPKHSMQRAISNYLDIKCSRIDNLIDLETKFYEKLTEYKQSIIYEYVTGKKRVPQEV